MHTKKKLLPIAALLAVPLPFAAQAGAVGGPTSCVQPALRFINGATPDHATIELPSVLAAGRYRVTIHTSDGYETRAQSDPAGQISERVTILGITTSELADGVAHANGQGEGEVDIPTAITSVEATHTHGNGPDSVVLDAVCFELLYPPTTTTQPPATVTVPTTPLCYIPETGQVEHREVCPPLPGPTTPAPGLPVPPSTTTTKPAPHYPTCADAPGTLHRGDPGYRAELDSDGDGTACEAERPAPPAPPKWNG